MKRHRLDPGLGGPCPGGCDPNPVNEHCHCDYHDGDHGCRWGNGRLIERLTERVPKYFAGPTLRGLSRAEVLHQAAQIISEGMPADAFARVAFAEALQEMSEQERTKDAETA